MRIDLTGSEYTLKHMDTPLLRYKVTEDTPEKSTIKIVKLYVENSHLFPIGVNCSRPRQVLKWLCERAAAGTRDFTDILLRIQHVDLLRPLHILAFTRGVSLTDVYWVEGSVPTTFASVNLYTNSPRLFDENAVQVSLLGTSTSNPSGGIADICTDGMLPKAWIYQNGLYLYKSGAVMEGFTRRLMQPYSEYFAYNLAYAMGLPAVPYTLDNRFGVVCSVCPLFTSPDVGFIKASATGLKGDALDRLLLEIDGRRSYNDMRIFDYLTGNTDRHAGNYGFMVDNRTNRITSFGPIFDNGEGLYGRLLDEVLEKMPVRVLAPSMTVMRSLEPRHLPMLQSLRFFKFQQHPVYKVTDARLMKMNNALQRRVNRLIKMLT